MKKRGWSKVATTALVGMSLLSFAPTTIALAKNVGGGDWTWGRSWNYGWSRYYHGTRMHSASVAHNSTVHRDTKRRGSTAYAEYHKFPSNGLSYWWNVY